jgi:hypothetical protein
MSALSPLKTLELLRFGLCHVVKGLIKHLILFIERHPYLKFLIGPLSSQLLLHFPCQVLLVNVLWYHCISISVFSLDVNITRYILYHGNCFFDYLSPLLYCFVQLLIIFDYSMLTL